MCSGRVDLNHVIRAFLKGADGVFIGACHLGECNYVTHGNYHALTMVHLAKKLMERIGMDPERLKIQFMSGAEASLFVESVNEFVKKVKEIGPLTHTEDLVSKLDVLSGLVPYIRLVERERLRLPSMTEEGYETFFASDECTRIITETIGEKLALAQIVALLRKRSLTTGEIAAAIGLSPSEVSKHLATSSRHRLVRYDQEQKRYALSV